mgnify:CR=1 FL=1
MGFLQMGRIYARMRARLREMASMRPGPGRLSGWAHTSLAVSFVAASPSLAEDMLATAAGFGLVTGLVEGTGLWALQRLHWLRGPIAFLGASPDAIWLSMIFDLLLFGGVGLSLILFARLVRRFPIKGFSIFALTYLTFSDWLALPLLGASSSTG